MEHWWNDTDRVKQKVVGQTFVPIQLLSSQISHRLNWDRTVVTTMRDLQLTAEPCHGLKYENKTELCLKIQSVPRSKHTPFRLYKPVS